MEATFIGTQVISTINYRKYRMSKEKVSKLRDMINQLILNHGRCINTCPVCDRELWVFHIQKVECKEGGSHAGELVEAKFNSEEKEHSSFHIFIRTSMLTK
jgi:hypothetical protein